MKRISPRQFTLGPITLGLFPLGKFALGKPSPGRSILTQTTLLLFLAAILYYPAAPATTAADAGKPIRLGYFPNVTHAQALYGKASGDFERAVGTKIVWTAFNAGPSAVEALFADELDAAYIGPNPTINGFIKSRGEKFVVVSGAAMGGAGLVIRPESGIRSEKDFSAKKIATPQLGNTQDVAARLWFKEKGYTLSEKGGTLTLIPIANSDQLNLFKKGEIDGSWSVEPWISRLEQEAGGKLLVDEGSLWPDGKYITTNLVFSKRFLAEQPEAASALLKAHIEATDRINADKKAAAELINRQLKTELGSSLPAAVMQSAINRVTFSIDPAPAALKGAADAAFEVGFIKEKADLAGLHNLTSLSHLLLSMGRQEMKIPPLN